MVGIPRLRLPLESEFEPLLAAPVLPAALQRAVASRVSAAATLGLSIRQEVKGDEDDSRDRPDLSQAPRTV
jgi:hypothetical protein